MAAARAKRCFICGASLSDPIWDDKRRRLACIEQSDKAHQLPCWRHRFPKHQDVAAVFLQNMANMRADGVWKSALQDRRRDLFERVLMLLESHTLTAQALAAIDVEFGAQRYKVLSPLLVRIRPDLQEVSERAFIYSTCSRELMKFRELGLPEAWDAALHGFAEALESERQLRIERGWRGKHQRLRIETTAHYVKGAAAFLRLLHELGVSDLRLLNQHYLDVFLLRSNASYCRTAAIRFIRWARPKYGLIGRMFAPARRSRERKKPVLAQEELHGLIRDVTSSTATLPTRIAALLCALYGQSVSATTARRPHEFDVGDESVRIVFGKIPVVLDTLTSRLLREWLVERSRLLRERRLTSDFLFPSALGGVALQPATLAKAVNKAFGYSPVQLRTTALHNAVRSGIREAPQLVAYFGVTSQTARRVLTENGRLLFEATPEGAATLRSLMRDECKR